MPTIPLNITGGTYKHKSLPLSAQVTRNFWPQLQQENSTKSPYVLEVWPGKKVFGSSQGSRCRGMKEHKGTLYKVTDTTLYTVASDGAHTPRGTITGSGRCVIEGIGDKVVIAAEGKAYEYDPSGPTLTTITDPDLETPNSCAHLNNQMIYDGDGGRFGVSNVGDATSIGGLNYATAESNADDTLRVYTFDQLLYVLGEKTIETWWNSGTGNPPFDRVEGGIIQTGIGAIYSVANSANWIYFLGDDNQVYRMRSGSIEAILPQPIAREVAGYSLVSDAVGFCMNLDGQWFYIITFITANKTFAYPENGEIFELSSGNEGGKDKMASYAFAYRKHLVGDFDSGNIFELDMDTYDDNGDAIIRTRDTGPLHGGLVGAPGKSIEVNRFELLMETGVGLLSGQGKDPKVMLSWSDDGGRTFSTEQQGSVGGSGQFMKKVEWFGLGSTSDARIFRIRTSDPVHFCIHSAAVDVEIGI